MKKRRRLSVRARLTFFFVATITVLAGFTGVGIIKIVERQLTNHAISQIAAVTTATQERFALAKKPTTDEVILPMHGDVVVQVVSLDGKTVWGASSAIADEGVLARAISDPLSSNGLGVRYTPLIPKTDAQPNLSLAQVSTITTKRGPGLIFGFIYGSTINHSINVLLTSLLISVPLLLIVSAGLIWAGIGLALAPVEAIRRRVDQIAAEDLTQRVPTTEGDDEIARMARTVNAMLERLESASKFQTEFVSNASHELRSPLTTLLATTERAQSNPSKANWPEVAEIVSREGRRLDSLIDDLFWLARHDENHIEFQRVEVDLDDLLFEEAQRVRSMSEFKVDTSNVVPVRVLGDPATLKRMVRNIVDNALRYTVKDMAFALSADTNVATMLIANDGEPVDVGASDQLFERFMRADPARSRQSGGTGLGLSIVREIAQRHGGSARFVPVQTGVLVELTVRRDGVPLKA